MIRGAQEIGRHNERKRKLITILCLRDQCNLQQEVAIVDVASNCFWVISSSDPLQDSLNLDLRPVSYSIIYALESC